eukprot:4093165-Prorocentrum_lima.AAC.1
MVSCGTCPSMIRCSTRARLRIARGSLRSMIQYSLRDRSGPGLRWCGNVRSMVGSIFLMCVRVVLCCGSGSRGAMVVELMSLNRASTSGSAVMSVSN